MQLCGVSFTIQVIIQFTGIRHTHFLSYNPKKRTQSANKSVEAIARKAFVIASMGDAGLKEPALLLATIMQTKFNAETIKIKI